MTSDKIALVLDKISNTQSPRQKETLIGKFADDLEFRRVLEYAYNPFKHYCLENPNAIIDHIHSGETTGFKPFTPLTWSALNKILNKNVRGISIDEFILNHIKGMTKDSALLLVKILRKNLKAGISIQLINSAIHGLLPAVPRMRSSRATSELLSKYDFNIGVFAQERVEGIQVNVTRHTSSDWSTITSTGDVIPNTIMNPIYVGLKHTPIGYQIHGCLVSLRNGTVANQSEIKAQLSELISNCSKDNSIIDIEDFVEFGFIAWDVISLSELAFERSDLMYGIRFKMLRDCIPRKTKYTKIINSEVCNSLDDLLKQAGKFVKNGSSGAIAKNWYGPWVSGVSLDQCSIQPTFRIGLKIVGILNGELGSKAENKPQSCICESQDGEITCSIQIDDANMVRSIQRKPERWIGKVIDVLSTGIVISEIDGVVTQSLQNAHFANTQFDPVKEMADTVKEITSSYKAITKGNIEL